MVGWMKASVGRIKSWLVGSQPEMVLLGLVLVYVFASLVLHGCGGGGGGGGGGQQPPQINSRGAVQGCCNAFEVLSSIEIEIEDDSKLRRLLRQETCPRVTSNWDWMTFPPPNPVIITFDYGTGCKKKDGNSVSGSFTVSIRNLRFDLTFDTATVEFNNYSVNGETYSGTIKIEIVDERTGKVFFDLEFRTGDCRERQTFKGTAFSDDETSFTVNGSGTFSASYLGNLRVNYTVTNLRFKDEDEDKEDKDCDFPVGGTMRATYNGTTEEWRFSPGTCGVGFVSVNGGPFQQVNLEELPSCG